jgi:hypothetical protein
LCAFLDSPYQKYSFRDTAISLSFSEMVKVEHSKNSAENHDFKECIKSKILSQYLDEENLNSKNPLYGGQYYGIGQRKAPLNLLGTLHFLLESEKRRMVL